MTDLSPKERALLALSEGGDDPSEAARGHMRSNLFAQLGIGTAAAGATATAAKAATAGTAGASAGAAAATTAATGATKGAIGTAATGVATTKVTAIKVVVGAALVTALGGAGYVAATDGGVDSAVDAGLTTPTHAVVDGAVEEMASTAPTDHGVDDETDDDPTANEDDDEPPAAAVAASPRPRASGGPAIGGELGMLQKAQRELRGGDADGALEVLDAHERKYGKGSLGEERMAVRVFALCEAGRVAEARGAAARFLAAHPQSPLASRVARACVDGKP